MKIIKFTALSSALAILILVGWKATAAMQTTLPDKMDQIKLLKLQRSIARINEGQATLDKVKIQVEASVAADIAEANAICKEYKIDLADVRSGKITISDDGTIARLSNSSMPAQKEAAKEEKKK